MDAQPEQMPDDDLQGFFARQEGVRLAYLFGSRAEGRADERSDYDFGLLLSPDADPDARYRLAHELAELLDADAVDVVPLRRAPIELAFHVIADGRLIYECSVAERVDFEARIMSRYGDWVPVLRRQREDIIRESVEGNLARRGDCT
ncbi:MAG: nucleotidyltransferase domain-containing protein [Candidatus Brocadiia bacterium]